MVCVNVKQSYASDALKLDLINMNTGASWFHSDEMEDMDGTGNFTVHSLIFFTDWVFLLFSATVIPRRENLNVVSVHQIEGDAIVVCYEGKI
jgi:hypothetical protein